MKGRVFKRCQCPPAYRVDDRGKQRRVNCRKDHGSWSFTHDAPDSLSGKRRQVVRGGYTSQTEAQEALTLSLAAVARGEFVETGRSVPTLGKYLDEWLASKRDLRHGTRENYRQHIDNHIRPLIGRVKLTELRAHHIDRMLTTIRDGDQATNRKPVGVATSRRVFSTLRVALNAAVKKRMLTFSPCQGVVLESEPDAEATVWSAEQVRGFLMVADRDRLAVLLRLVLHRGLRRGEAVGLRWQDVDLAAGRITIRQSAVQVGGTVLLNPPKTKSGKRVVSIGPGTVAALRRHRTAQNAERLAWADAYEESDLVFAREDGSVERPDRVSRRFKQLAVMAGLPVIRLHEGRHSAASLALESGASMKEVQDLLGHTTYSLTADTYSHVSPSRRDQGADRVERYIDGATAEG